jgi:hypothetical protein
VIFPTTVPFTVRQIRLRPALALGRARRRHLLAVIVLLGFLLHGLPRADAAEPPATLADAGAPGTDELPAGLQLSRPEPAAHPTMVSRWWFWTAVGAVAAATATVIIVSSRGSAPPTTNLGNQVFAP